MPPIIRKRFGQHFLISRYIIECLVDEINPQPDQSIIEIGPGQGALTLPILKKTGKMDVIEIDRDLIPLLRQHCAGHGDLIIHEANALKFDIKSLIQKNKTARIIGNLPYNISTPLIFHLLESADAIEDMHFMLQKEVVERMAAKPNDDAYGRLSIMVQYHCEVSDLFDVPPSSFEPPPRVDSSVVRLTPHSTLPFIANDYHQFLIIVREAFSHRRKTLRNALKPFVSDAIWAEIGINPQQRPEELSVQDFVVISNAIEKNG